MATRYRVILQTKECTRAHGADVNVDGENGTNEELRVTVNVVTPDTILDWFRAHAVNDRG